MNIDKLSGHPDGYPGYFLNLHNRVPIAVELLIFPTNSKNEDIPNTGASREDAFLRF